MSSRAKTIIGVLGVLVLTGLAALVFLRYQVTKSFPQKTGTVQVQGLSKAVDIYSDPYGVPLISAQNEHDLLFSLGYVHAQDRLWQMDMTRRIGEGRLSEIIGLATLPFDKMFRIIGIRRISEEIERKISEESRQRLRSYADGVNAFIESHKGKYPVEFDLLGYEPEPWLPVHSILIGRMMAWELNLSWWTDLTFGALSERVGLENMIDVLPSFPEDVPPAVPASEWKSFAHQLTDFLKVVQDYRDYVGQPGTLGGSNAWVVAPRKSESGKVILASDLHLQLHAPSKWYEVQLKAPGVTVSGFSIPGVPGVVIGRNEFIAWGMTNVMADDADFYIEKLDSTDSAKYFYDGEWRQIEFREEEIRLKGDSVVTLTVRSTHHGPIVTDIATPLRESSPSYVASMRWTGFEISDQIDVFYKINRARNWEEFQNGISGFTGPGQNFVYGDAEGNIGFWSAALIPIRDGRTSVLPLPGWEKSTEWKGFVPFQKLPHLFNPPEGFIATANNKLVDDSYPYHISDLWEPPSRIQRLRDVLIGEDLFSIQDFERLQNDTYSHWAKEVTPYILEACGEGVLEGEGVIDALVYMRNWNFHFSQEDIATSIFQSFMQRLLENIYKDEMGDEIFHDYVTLVNLPIRTATKLLRDGNSVWFDDIGTPEEENRDDIIRKSLLQGLKDLRDRFGKESKKWRWGDMHTVTLRHPFGKQKPLDKVFDIGPFPYGGGSTSLISGEHSYNSPFEVTVGASLRMIYDFSHPDEIRMVLPTGQSGQVFHQNYDDQTHLWLGGLYRTTQSGRKLVDNARTSHLRLEPDR